ncbi:cytochrome P450 [Lentithecium fluviatile CBS 122367]|uniref:Cytochrome P450 n=1 Tax=Lentithecium fluviatile CBS 122367 TaxID=1168545 RepID=A0A6G1J7X2_9PLEO|nr:cytochrome P450 [Lentithecium fluviatile CBS 122367]
MGLVPNTGVALGALVALCVVRFVYLVIYRLFFSPLAKFPGPKLAAATGWYEFYFDYFFNGKYVFEIERMHKVYGPIVRVNPDELSIHDPSYYTELYVTGSTRRSEHYDNFVKGIDFEASHILTRDHDLHRQRRKPLDPFFSRNGVQRLQGMLGEVILKMETRLHEFSGTKKVVRLDHVFSAFSSDVMCRICLSGGPDGEKKPDFLDDADFSPDWFDCIVNMVKSLPLFTGFPWIIHIVSFIPMSILLRLLPAGKTFSDFRKFSLSCIQEAIRVKEDNDRKGIKTDDRGSIFLHLANSDMPASERSPERLVKEAQVLLAGGTATTSHSLGYAAFQVLYRPQLREALKEELTKPMADWPRHVPTWAELEKLPLLTAVIKESLRLAYGVMHRLPRVSPDVALQYGEYTIPPGVPVGMSTYFMHTDPEAFPDPFAFKPERWLGKLTPAMLRNYVPFARGSRNCLGQNLGQAELYLALAVLFRPGGPKLELFETDETDVTRVHDFIISLPKVESKGIRATVG